MTGYRSSHNPYGSNALLVDKLIGTAYDTVKYVAMHLRLIQYVSDNMDKIYEVGANLKSERVVESPITFYEGEFHITIPTEINETAVTSFETLIRTSDRGLYNTDSGLFTTHIEHRTLVLKVNADSEDLFSGGTLIWTIRYKD